MEVIDLHFGVVALSINEMLAWNFEIDMHRIGKSTPSMWEIGMGRVRFCVVSIKRQ